MHFMRHPFVERDLIGMVDHIVGVTGGDVAAAERRLDEVDALLHAIQANPTSGARLRGDLDGWIVRHGGAGNRLTVVFRPDIENDVIYLALVAFGGRNWIRLATTRHSFAE